MILFGLGKPRTKLGKWIDKQGISQEDLVNFCGLSRNTASKIANDRNHKVTTATSKRVVAGLRKAGYDVEFGDLF